MGVGAQSFEPYEYQVYVPVQYSVRALSSFINEKFLSISGVEKFTRPFDE
jgi:hypothetical protein